MVTLEEIRKSSDLHNLPRYVHVNRNIILDFRLDKALRNIERDSIDRIYDFDVYLKSYGINLQRDYVWEYYQQNEFIYSVLLEKPIESVVVIEHSFDYKDSNNVVFYVIDGKQRLMTIQKFLRNEFAIVINGKNVYYNDFDIELKLYFSSRINSITATVYYSYPDALITDDMKISLFNYYNFAGTPQTEEHKRKLQSLLK